ncbi:MAG: class I tRNA ligase family protein, partial [Lachnospiraceae bacterium]|nr:class I tRNA ligase family protein [Lachnospiraceae bacterium]
VQFAKYWMHNAFLNIDNKKMSKSAGNFFTVRDIAEKYDLQVLRFFMLSAHYRSPLNFSADLMEAAKNGLERMVTCADKLNSYLTNESIAKEITDAEKQLISDASKYNDRYNEAMDDDFNTADAISVIFELVKFINTNTDENSSKEYVETLSKQLTTLADICGLILERKEEIIDQEIEDMIAARQAARKEKNFKLAAEIRDSLLQKGIILEDTREGVKWKRA